MAADRRRLRRQSKDSNVGKAVILDAIGGPAGFALRAQDPLVPGPGDIIVANRAIGLNFIDIYKRTGLYPAAIPGVLGEEGAGVVTAVGPAVSQFAPGDRVAYLAGGGAYAEETLCPASAAAKIPDGVDDETAAAAFLKGLTAQMLVAQVFALRADHTCLIYAAAGGVGTLLTQWAVDIGARVIAIVGSPEKAAIARSNGAAETIIRTQTDDIAAACRALTDGRGVDVVYDSVGAATFEASLDALALRGHMVTYGNASGPPPAVQPLELARRGSLSLTRPTLYHYATPDALPAMAEALFAAIARGAVAPAVRHRFALSAVADAHRLLESGDSAGAIVLTP